MTVNQAASSNQRRLAACTHTQRDGWQFQSTHETSLGTVGYARCSCGAWLVLLNGVLLAARIGDTRP